MAAVRILSLSYILPPYSIIILSLAPTYIVVMLSIFKKDMVVFNRFYFKYHKIPI